MGKLGFMGTSRKGLFTTTDSLLYSVKEHVPIEACGKNKSRAMPAGPHRLHAAGAVWSRLARSDEALPADAAVGGRQDPRTSFPNRGVQRYRKADPESWADALRSHRSFLVRRGR